MKQETFTDIEYSFRKKKTKREEFLEIIGKEGVSGVKAPSVGGHTDISVFGRDIRWWRMPSTSRAYPMKLEEKTLHYRKALTPFGK